MEAAIAMYTDLPSLADKVRVKTDPSTSEPTSTEDDEDC